MEKGGDSGRSAVLWRRKGDGRSLRGRRRAMPSRKGLVYGGEKNRSKKPPMISSSRAEGGQYPFHAKGLPGGGYRLGHDTNGEKGGKKS